MLVLALFAVVLMIVSASKDASAGTETAFLVPVELVFDPSQTSLAIGQSSNVSIVVGEGAADLYGAQYRISYDAQIISIVSVDQGQLLLGNGLIGEAGGFYSDSATPSGAVTFVTTLLNPANAADGPGALTTLSIRCIANGSTSLVFSNVMLADQNFQEVPVVPQSGEVICGQIALYNATSPPQGPRNIARMLLTRRARMEGFLVFQYADRHQEGLDRLASWIRDGSLKYREDVVEGIENSPSAFIGLLEGANFGKLVIKVS